MLETLTWTSPAPEDDHCADVGEGGVLGGEGEQGAGVQRQDTVGAGHQYWSHQQRSHVYSVCNFSYTSSLEKWRPHRRDRAYPRDL